MQRSLNEAILGVIRAGVVIGGFRGVFNEIAVTADVTRLESREHASTIKHLLLMKATFQLGLHFTTSSNLREQLLVKWFS